MFMCGNNFFFEIRLILIPVCQEISSKKRLAANKSDI
jgi:hypothetical protein